jgi:hypothetical protein
VTHSKTSLVHATPLIMYLCEHIKHGNPHKLQQVCCSCGYQVTGTGAELPELIIQQIRLEYIPLRFHVFLYFTNSLKYIRIPVEYDFIYT